MPCEYCNINNTNNNNNNNTNKICTDCLNTEANINLTEKGNGRNRKNWDHFIDNEFPPNKKSIYTKKPILPIRILLHSGGLNKAKYWRRPNEVNFSSRAPKNIPISLYQSNSSAQDVVQGGVGSCWFISALSIISERPEILSNILMTKNYNQDGLHQIRLCKRGQWVVVNIDDYLPCNRRGKIIFAYAKQKQFWVSFIEKALAKLYGSYESIASGACVEGLQTLTGEPCEIVYLENAKLNLNNPNYTYLDLNDNNPNYLWKKLMFSKQVGYLMTTLCFNKNINVFELYKVGLFNRHIYSVLDVRQVFVDGKQLNLIKLRNPWGKKEWKGAWSNKWPYWPLELKSQLLNIKPNTNKVKTDGCFWISFNDLLKYFYDISICKVRSDWYESRHSSFFYDYSQSTEVFILNIQEPGEHQFEIELFATGRKFEPFDRNQDPNIDLFLCLCRVDTPDNKLECIQFEHNVEYFINMSCKLQSGIYLIFATSIKAISNLHFEKSANYFSYNLAVHGQSQFSLSKKQLSNDFVSDIFYSIGLKSNKTRLDLDGNLKTLIIPGNCTHGIIIENISRDLYIKVNIDLAQSKNLETTRFSDTTQDIIEPGSRQLIAYLTPFNYKKGFIIGYKIETQIVQPDKNLPKNQPYILNVFNGIHSIKRSS